MLSRSCRHTHTHRHFHTQTKRYIQTHTHVHIKDILKTFRKRNLLLINLSETKYTFSLQVSVITSDGKALKLILVRRTYRAALSLSTDPHRGRHFSKTNGNKSTARSLQRNEIIIHLAIEQTGLLTAS